MGAFDDLIPKAAPRANAFGDLIPPQPSLIDNLAAAVMPTEAPSRGRNAPSRAAPVREEDVDPSTALGDLEAGALTAGMILPGLEAMIAADRLGATLTRPETLADRGVSQIDILRQQGGALADPRRLAQIEAYHAEKAAEAEAAIPGALPDLATALMGPLAAITSRQEQIAAIPTNPAFDRLAGAESVGDGVSALRDDPLGVVRTALLRSLPASLPGIAGAVGGMALGGPGGAAAGAAGGEFLTEAGISAAQGVAAVLQEAGVDITSQEAVQAFAAENPEAFQAAVTDALQRAGIIATTGAVGGAATGALARRAVQTGGGRAARDVGIALGVDPAIEGAGEAAAGGSTGDVLAEMIGGAGQGAVQTGGQAAVELLRRGRTSPPPEMAQGPSSPPAPERPATLPTEPAAPRPFRATEPVVEDGNPGVSEPAPASPEPMSADGDEAGASAPIEQIPASQVIADPKTFQFKSDGDEQGVTDTMRGTKRWEPAYAGIAIVYENNAGERFIVDGHQRLGLARRLEAEGHPPIMLNAQVLRERDGWTPAEARAAGAMKNIAEGGESTNPVDVAKVIREGMDAEMLAETIPPRRQAFRDGRALARLGDDAFGMVINEVVPVPFAAEVAGVISDPAQQVAALEFMAQRPPANRAQARMVAQQIAAAGFDEGQTDSLFGPEAFAESLMVERAAVLDAAMKALKSRKGALTNALSNAAVLQSAGSQIDEEGARAATNLTERAALAIEKLATRAGPVSDALARAARRLKDGDPRAAVVAGFLDEVEGMGEGAFGAAPAPGRDPEGLTDDGQDDAPQGRADQGGARAVPPVAEGGRGAEPGDGGDRPSQGAAPTGTEDEGGQAVIPGAERIGDGERARRGQEAPMRGGAETPPEGGLFSPPGPELFDDKGVSGPTSSAPRVVAEDASAPTRKRQGRTQPRGSLGPTFTAFSFTDKNSVFEAAFRAAGYEPDKARLKSVDEQITILKDVLLRDYGVRVSLPDRWVVRKTITGRQVKERQNRISHRDAIDQMLDAYRQMEMMAHVFQLPRKAVGLLENGNSGPGVVLSLTNRLPGALGSYSYSPEGGDRIITLPGRSNSFSHEWGHAFDHYISRLIWKNDGAGMMTRELQSEGHTPDTRKNEIAQAGGYLLQTMFGERAALAAMQIDLMVAATEVNRKGNPTARAKKAKKALEDIEVGRKLPREVTSEYFKTSDDFDKMFDAGGYFTDPAEMFARSMETYVGIKARQIAPDLPTSFLSKPDWAYTSSEDTRAKATFPRGLDGEAIFTAIDRLMGAVRRHGVFGDGRAQKPEDVDIADPRKWDLYRPKGTMVEREAKAWRQAKRQAEAIERTHPISQRIGDVASMTANSFGAHLHRVVNRQPAAAQASLRNLVDMFATDPGSGRVVGQVWEEAVEAHTGRTLNRYENIVEAHDLDAGNEKQMAELRRLLTVPNAKAADPKLVAAAADLRRLMDAEWRYVSEAGVKVGYVKNGWLPRLPDVDIIMEDHPGFLKAAEKVYRAVFGNDVRSGNLEDEITDLRRVLGQLKRDTMPTEEGDRFRVNRIPPSAEVKVEAWRKALNALRRAQRDLDAANKDGDGDKMAAAEARVAEATEAYEEQHYEMLDLAEDLWSKMAADHWLAKMMTGAPSDFDSRGPAETFTKKRTLPPEADEIMAKYYRQNPLELIEQYIHMAARRAEYVRRAGPQSQKIENMLERAARDGADGRDIKEMRRLIRLLAGRQDTSGSSALANLGGWAYVTATLALLNKATISSLVESMSVGLRTGRLRDSFRATALTMGQALPKGSAQERRDIARIIGIVRSAHNETVMMNRYGGEVDPSQMQTRIMSNFFRRIGLTGLTNAQRTAMIQIGGDHLKRMLGLATGRAEQSWLGVSPKSAIEELGDLGVPERHHEALLDWLEGIDGLPGPDDLMGVDGDYYNDAAALWASAVSRFVNTTIQNPRKYTRPAFAQQPGLRMIYGITGFIYGFHREVLARLFRANIDARRPGESRLGAAARQTAQTARNLAVAAPAAGALWLGHILTTTLREALFNRDEWEEREDDGNLEEWLAARAFSRTGLTGVYDIPLQLATGLRYERDIASTYAGPHVGYWLDNAEAALKLGGFGRNSPNTNTTEIAAAKRLADTAWSVSTAMILSTLPGGPLLNPAYGVALYGAEAISPAELLE